MFEFTNEQRKCFGLLQVADSWERMEWKPYPDAPISAFAYLDGNRIRKYVWVCDSDPAVRIYCEAQINEALSDDRKKILPKTERGKPRTLSYSSLLQCTLVVM